MSTVRRHPPISLTLCGTRGIYPDRESKISCTRVRACLYMDALQLRPSMHFPTHALVAVMSNLVDRVLLHVYRARA